MIQDMFQRVGEFSIVYQYIAIFVIALVPFLEVFVAVPVGLLLNLPFIPVLLIGTAANWISVMVVIVYSTFIRTLLSKKNHSSHFLGTRFTKAKIYFNRYGVPGISLIGPLIGANHIGALVCVMAKANKKRIILWQTISIVIWGAATGVLFLFGVNIYKNI